MYASLSSKYSIKKRSKGSDQAENPVKRLAYDACDGAAPVHGAQRIQKDKRTLTSDTEDDEDEAARDSKKKAPMDGVSQAQFINTRPGPYDKLLTREQLIAALTSSEIINQESLRAAAEARRTQDTQYQELELMKNAELEEINSDLNNIEFKCTELAREKATLEGTVKHMSELMERHEEVLTAQTHKAAQSAMEVKRTADTLIGEADSRATAYKEKLQLSRKRREEEMHQFEETLQLVKAMKHEQPVKQEQPEQPEGEQPKQSDQEHEEFWRFDTKRETESQLSGMDEDEEAQEVIQRHKIPGYDLITIVPLIAEYPSSIFFNEHELNVMQLADQIKASQKKVMAELSYLNSKGEAPDQVKDTMATHLEMLNEVSLAYTSKWFSWPITQRATDRQGKGQLCARCGTVPGDWSGVHKNKSACTSTKCARCHTLGLGVLGTRDSCNVHQTDKCPFADENIELFSEYVLRRLHHELRHVGEASLAGDFMNSFNK
jgi:hypothetical protein